MNCHDDTFVALVSFFYKYKMFCYVSSERPVLLRGLHGGDPAVLHDHGQAHDAQDADADGGRERVQELLHHLRHVPAGVLLRARRDHRLRECQVRGGDRKVSVVDVWSGNQFSMYMKTVITRYLLVIFFIQGASVRSW